MPDHNDSQAPECADEAMRDALPGLDHGRLAERERRALEAHLAGCAACSAELALLRDARLAVTSATPRLDLDRLALAVVAATVRPAGGARADVIPLAPRLAQRAATARRWYAGGGLRAAAAALLVALGAGGVTLARRDEPAPLPGATAAPAVGVADATPPAASAPRAAATSAPETAAAARARTAPAAAARTHALGEGFDDLSDEELRAVLRAIEGADASLPALEPAVHASEYRGGGE